MSLSQSPYVGTWKISGKKLVQHTPDAMVYLNGDTALPGCSKCHRRIDFQQFLTEVSVDAGTEPGGASASFTLSVPMHHTDSFARDAKFLLRPGLEVHVYSRGYFPAEGLFSALAKPSVKAEVRPGTEIVEDSLQGNQQAEQAAQAVQGPGRVSAVFVSPPEFNPEQGLTREQVRDWAQRLNVSEDMLMAAIVLQSESERPNEAAPITHTLFNRQALPKYHSPSGDSSIWYIALGSNKYTGVQDDFSGGARAYSTGRIPTGQRLDMRLAQVEQTLADRARGQTAGSIVNFLHTEAQNKGHARDPALYASADAKSQQWQREGLTQVGGWDPNRVRFFAPTNANRQADPGVVADLALKALGSYNPSLASRTGTPVDPEKRYLIKQEPGGGLASEGPSLLDEMGLGETGIDQIVAYPYYHIFHGVTTQVTFNYASGVQTITVQCSSLLHFWQYQHLSENASFLGARPTNSKLKMSLVGSNFSGKHPYQIIYELYSDVGGAAHGVGWALGSTTNQESLAFNGDSLFSLTLNYWEKRFRSRMNKLRMHGISGELFSTAQAAYLSKLPTTDLVRLIKNRHSLVASQSNSTKGFLNNSWATHIKSKRALEAFILQQRSRPGVAAEDGNPSGVEGLRADVELNVAEMQPFPLDLGKMGQVEIFESTYVSKQDVAQKVMEITGYEFYQDVDGDFVFKPPMYNLDTSASRVYRIEDIDIISINFSEKEPVATYITAKGSAFQNFMGTGLENEWGVRGQYIDYRLVAQFGWRPASMDSTYFNDPKSLFYAAVNRLDIMNAPISSATVSIPLRPELRPGYPVYIPYLDAFYYCPSFAHSFSVGGTCQTTLQLISKRAKFYAPGVVDPSIQGIEAIDLSRPSLPERPLQVMDEEGRPRLTGFPNVVMALDPYRLNPLFFLVGTDVENLGDPQVLQNLLDLALEFGILKKDDTTDPPTYVMETLDATGKPRNVRFNNQGLNEVRYTRASDQGAISVNLQAAGSKYMEDARERLERKKTLEKQLFDLEAKIRSARGILEGAYPNMTDQDKAKARILLDGMAPGSELDKAAGIQAGQTGLSEEEKKAQQTKKKLLQQGLYAQRSQLQTELDSVQTALAGVEAEIPGLTELKKLIEETGNRSRFDPRFEVPDLESTSNLLDLLSEKKALFTNGQQPGYFRYYSASHPNPKHQGQPLLRIEKDPKAQAGGAVNRGDPVLSEDFKNETVLGFLKQPTASFPGGQRPEAELAENQKVTWGIRVLTSSSAKSNPHGVVIPTNQIREVMFARHEASLRRPLTSVKREEVPQVTPALSEALRGSFSFDGRPPTTETLRNLFEPQWNERVAALPAAQQAAASRLNTVLPDVRVEPFPETVVVDGFALQTDKTLEQLWDYLGAAGASGLKSVMDLMGKAASYLGDVMSQGIQNARSSWEENLKTGLASEEDRNTAKQTFDLALASKLSVKSIPKSKQETKKSFKLETTFESPVFPVSDEKGYHVFGSYRYGRGIDVDPNGVFDVLHKQDPASMLSRPLVESLVSVLVDGKHQVTIYDEEITANGQKKLVPRQARTPQEAVTGLEKMVLRELRAQNLTDKDLLNLGLATTTSDPGVLKLSLQNFYANKASDSLMKVPLVNAAYSLADLNQSPVGHVCSCKAAEAGVLLEAFGQAEFVPLDPSTVSRESQDSPDALTQWLGRTVAQNVDPWRQEQDALRGTVLDRPGPNIVQAFNDLRTTQLLDDITDTAKREQKAIAFRLAQVEARARNLTGEDS